MTRLPPVPEVALSSDQREVWNAITEPRKGQAAVELWAHSRMALEHGEAST